MGENSDVLWRRPGRCATESACVEVAFTGDRVLVRNSREPGGPVAPSSRAEWAEFVPAVKDDEFDA